MTQCDHWLQTAGTTRGQIARQKGDRDYDRYCKSETAATARAVRKIGISRTWKSISALTVLSDIILQIEP